MTQLAKLPTLTVTADTITADEVPTALACPSCERCQAPTRFIGLEAVAGNRAADLCTYECTACGHSQVSLVPRDPNGSESLRV